MKVKKALTILICTVIGVSLIFNTNSGSYALGKEPIEIISKRSEYEKHFDNGDFSEASHRDCDGSIGILDIMKAYHDCGFDGYMRPDHGRHIWGEKCRPGYGLYDRALGIMYLLGCWDSLEKFDK